MHTNTSKTHRSSNLFHCQLQSSQITAACVAPVYSAHPLPSLPMPGTRTPPTEHTENIGRGGWDATGSHLVGVGAPFHDRHTQQRHTKAVKTFIFLAMRNTWIEWRQHRPGMYLPKHLHLVREMHESLYPCKILRWFASIWSQLTKQSEISPSWSTTWSCTSFEPRTEQHSGDIFEDDPQTLSHSSGLPQVETTKPKAKRTNTLESWPPMTYSFWGIESAMTATVKCLQLALEKWGKHTHTRKFKLCHLPLSKKMKTIFGSQ